MVKQGDYFVSLTEPPLINIRKDKFKNYLNTGVDPNIKNSRGVTALHQAAFYNRKDIVDILLKAGADINIRDNNNLTPLHKASKNGNIEIVKILVENGANIHARSNLLNTPLYMTTLYNNVDIFEYLISKGSNPFSRNKYMKCALDVAKINKCNHIIKCLKPLYLNKYSKIIQRACSHWIWGNPKFNYRYCADGTIPIQPRIGLKLIANLIC